MGDGHLDLKHAVDAIQLGHSYRRDLGDLDALCESIRTVGLLHPVVISPDGLLISGRRRLEAVKRLGWKQVPVWIAAKVSDRLLTVLAVQHENTIRKDLTPVEAAELYDELKTLYAEDAARRQAASRFGNNIGPSPRTPGAVESTAPGDTRTQAARAITGRDSHGKLEQVLELKRITNDDDIPDWLRAQTDQALAELNVDQKVNGRYLAIKAAEGRHQLEQATTDPSLPDTARHVAQAELAHLATIDHPKAAARAAKRATKTVHDAAAGWKDAHPAGPDMLAAGRFAACVKKHYGWWNIVDPHTVAAQLSDEQWEMLMTSYTATQTFMRTTITARETGDGMPAAG